MQMHAIRANGNPAPVNIVAALKSPAIANVRSLMASAKIAPVRAMTIAEVDAKLSASGLTIKERLELKSAMSRAGLMV